MAKYLSAGYVCDECDKPLIEADAPCMSVTETRDGHSCMHVLHEACLPAYAAEHGWDLPLDKEDK